ncbi:helix-turn-helix transcriptional regulator [Amycolatopsis sp. NPDC023774]|uniref:ArsR/SmtB family transcription factor n=1 Tax=Amycolatopsis sp. NPDC023774 TaxID=3155015 RepID=UPI0033FF12CE
MTAGPDIATVAQAIGEPARAAMLLQLMDGDAHTARALATVAGIAPSTASAHLRRLCDAGLVRVTESGRRRLHRLTGPEVAHVVEALAALAPPRLPANLQPDLPTNELLEARVCYGHLGGRLGVTIAARLQEDGVVGALRPGDTDSVRTFDHPLLTALGITGLTAAPPVRPASTGTGPGPFRRRARCRAAERPPRRGLGPPPPGRAGSADHARRPGPLGAAGVSGGRRFPVVSGSGSQRPGERGSGATSR